MKHPLPRTPAEWLKEIKLAIADASEAEPFGPLVGTEVTDANLFHLAPLVCLKFGGRKLEGREAERVTKVALANYVVNSDPEGIDHGLEQRPMMAFTLGYVAAHLALELLAVRFAKALNRSVTGSMNDITRHAGYWLVAGDVSPVEIGFRLKESRCRL